MISLDQFIAKYSGQSVLYDKLEADRGQCVQLVCFYVQEVAGKPVIWANAAEWWYSNQYQDQYQRIANTASAVPQPGDIIVWDRNLPNSGGAGHIAVCVTPRPGTGTFISFDSNWGGKTAHLVTHNYNYVIGWLRPKGINPTSPAPAPQPQQGGDEMISTADQATKLYKMLRPNGGGSDGEINGTVNHRSFAQFLNDAQGEINNRDAGLRAQNDELKNMQDKINSLNQTITQLQLDMTNKDTAGTQKAQQLKDAQDKIASLTAELTTSHDKITDLQNTKPQATPESPTNTQPIIDRDPGWVVKLIASLLPKKKS